MKIILLFATIHRMQRRHASLPRPACLVAWPAGLTPSATPASVRNHASTLTTTIGNDILDRASGWPRPPLSVLHAEGPADAGPSIQLLVPRNLTASRLASRTNATGDRDHFPVGSPRFPLDEGRPRGALPHHFASAPRSELRCEVHPDGIALGPVFSKDIVLPGGTYL